MLSNRNKMKFLILLATIAATQAGVLQPDEPLKLPGNLQITIPETTPNPPSGTPDYVIPGQHSHRGMAYEGEFELPLLPPTKIRSLPLDPKDRASVPIYKVNLRLDWFNSSDPRRIPIRYAFNTQYWTGKGKGPLYIFVGGESNFEEMFGYLYSGMFAESAKDAGAVILMNEHRFYGQSIPADGQTAANLKYLTVKQSMADLAYIVQNLRVNNNITKVVLMGGSYPGSLAAWMRLTYPNLVDIAVSSSGIAVLKQDNFGFNTVVTSAVRSYSFACRNTINNGFQYIINQLQTTCGQSAMQSYFNLSYSLNSPYNKQAFFNSLLYPIGQTVQYDKQRCYTSIALMCSNFINRTTQTETQKFLSIMREAIQTGIVQQASSANPDGKSWFYQVCYELGNYVTTTTYTLQMFGNANNVPLSFWQTVCQNLFGFNAAQQLAGNNALANSMSKLNTATKIIYTIGTNDPWKAVGMTSAPNTQTKVYIVRDSSHSAVLTPASIVNSFALTSARNAIKAQVKLWLAS